MLRLIREFMQDHDILEVETPILSETGNTDPNIQSLKTTKEISQYKQYYLNTSPEFAMKRLLASGSGSIYQITKVFRDDERGRLHQPEFTMLEWYRTDFDHHQLMDELAELVRELGLGECARTTYASVFHKYIGLDPHTATVTALASEAKSRGLSSLEEDRGLLLEFLFSHSIAPHLGQDAPIFVYDYPVCQAALAKLSSGDPQVAERFELFISGMEIANGFNELTDAAEQRMRFIEENKIRRSRGLEEVLIDEQLLAALQHGLPTCAGVALGLDRLLMILADSDNINDVITFPKL